MPETFGFSLKTLELTEMTGTSLLFCPSFVRYSPRGDPWQKVTIKAFALHNRISILKWAIRNTDDKYFVYRWHSQVVDTLGWKYKVQNTLPIQHGGRIRGSSRNTSKGGHSRGHFGIFSTIETRARRLTYEWFSCRDRKYALWSRNDALIRNLKLMK